MIGADEKYPYYFRYGGRTYTKETVVKLTQSYLDAHPLNFGCPTSPHYGEPITPLQMFCNRRDICGIEYYVFSPCREDRFYNLMFGYIQVHTNFLYIKASEIEDAIEEIIKPEPIVIVPAQKTKDWESPAIMVGWGLYILALLSSFIFKDWTTAWLIASLIFFTWRKKMKDE